MKILILKPSSLGDVIQALPVLRLLRLHYPRAVIHWWLNDTFAPLLENDPDLDQVIHFERRGWNKAGYWLRLLASVRRMRAERYDLVIDLQGLARSGFFAWAAHGEYSIGVEDRREWAYGFYDRVVPRPSPQTHAVDWYLEVLRALGVPVHQNFEWLAVNQPAAESVARRWPGLEGDWVALVPGARWLNKRWPASHFKSLVERIVLERSNVRFAVFGDKGDNALAAEIVAAAPDRCLSLTGQTTLAESIEWLRKCRLVVTNDTGPMHMAAALRKPVVSFFGPTNPARTGAYGQQAGALRVPLLCAPCLSARCRNPVEMECLVRITPENVAGVILRSI